MISITDEEMNIILDIIKKYAGDCKVLVFGSRLKGTNKPFSDLDLAFISNEKLGLKKFSKLKLKFEESDLPYRVDIIDYNRVSKEFKKLIDDENGKIYG